MTLLMPVPHYLINHTFFCNKFLKSEHRNLLTLFFFLRMILGILGGSLAISYEFQIQFICFYKEVRWDGVCVESVKQFEE